MENEDTQGPAAPAAPKAPEAPEAPENNFLSRSDFDSFKSELMGHLDGLRSSRQEPARREEARNPDEPSRPDHKSYKFREDPEALEKYHTDWYRYIQHKNKGADEAKLKERRDSEESSNIEREHNKRVFEYRRKNPDFDEDVKKNGAIQVYAPVNKAIYRHPKSEEIVHYLLKNPGIAHELNFSAKNGEEHSIPYRIGEIAAQIGAERKLAEANKAAAGARPPRTGLAGAAGKTGKDLSYAERVNRFNGYK